MKLTDIIFKSAEAALIKQLADGSMPPGYNGPYHDPETPVRNTAHWLFTFSSLYEKTGVKKWAYAASKASDYLCSKESRPMDATFWCRKNPLKDFCNGIMGQAWVMEGLIKAANVLEREDCYNTAEQVFLLHPFDEKKSIWQKVNVDGSYGGFDGTFNHQLWFAAIASQFKHTRIAQKLALEFLDKVDQKIELYKDGVVYHGSPVERRAALFNESPAQTAKYLFKTLQRIGKGKELMVKSVGYHSFNLYAFAMLKVSFPEHKFWKSKKMKKMLEAINTPSYRSVIEKSPYGYPYNPPGIETAFAIETFNMQSEEAHWWLNQQLKHTWDPKTGSMLSHNVPDPKTADARIYEALRLKNHYSLEI